MILFPNFEEEDDISQDIDISIPETEEKNLVSLFVIIFLIILGIIIYFIFKGKQAGESKTEKETIIEDNEKYLDKIIDIIKEEGGRTTQKEIRKEIPLSEAKISLMIAELEHKGVIEKIKKGRGNILILKKNGNKENKG